MNPEQRPQTRNLSLLERIARWGNRLPTPALLFFWLCVVMMVVSALAAALGAETQVPGQEHQVLVRSLLSAEGLRWILTHTVENFVSFAPVGTVLVAMLGLGVAEHSGLLRVLLERLVRGAPRVLMTWVVVFAGIVSNLAMDAGYVVLIPLAGVLFSVAGRPPLAGIAAAFAGVSAGYSANLLLGPADAILAGMSTEAANIVSPGYTVGIESNYYFAAVSAVLLSLVGTLVTERWVVPYLARTEGGEPEMHSGSGSDAAASMAVADIRGLWAVTIWTLLFVVAVVLASVPEGAPLRDPANPDFLNSAAVRGVVVLIAFYAAVAGWLFGRFSGRYTRSAAVVEAMETTMATMAGYLVLMFFAAQFVNYFAWSNLGTLLAVTGANWLEGLALPESLLLLVFVFMAAFINLFVGSASAKWGLLAPVFVPMLFLLGISPEATQMAFRIGDSSTNIITPLMPYFGVVVAFAQRYRPNLGLGTMMSMMLPYSVAFLIGWSLLMLFWLWLGWPLGPGAEVLLD
ncbi:AbgT family transporter [Marinimicrobium locisalis]|uniref:AbgT family transporter n=1 Tax=Marinimicrobium locisalis TaxID=546022 RepID=UPI003221C2FE